MAKCLSDEQLESLAAGSIPPEAAEPLRAHLTQCPTCREAVAEWRANLEFALTVKTALGDGVTLTDDSGSGPAPNVLDTRRPDAIPGYELHEELHHGAQGVVFRAVHRASERTVAVKFLHAGIFASESAQKRFDREIELARGLHHPNIIRVWDSGATPAGGPYYVMDYVPGLPLNAYVRDRKLMLEQVLNLFVSVCDAVNYAHQRGVIHRDLKPSNILVDAEGMPRVLDFGLAKWLPGSGDTGLSLAGQIMGTLPYMSPEQARGRGDQVDIRTDVYSLGVILYEMLTGGFPYPVTGPVTDVLRNIMETPPEAPQKRWSKESGIRKRGGGTDECPLDEEIETILLRALAKEPHRRYPNVAALMDDVSRHLRGQPIEARREARVSILTRTLARYRAAALLACTGLLLIASFTIALAWMYQDAKRQREQAAQDRAQAIRSQTLLAGALIRLGDRDLENGDEEEALGQYLAALAIKEHLAAANLDNLIYQKDLADTLLRLGDLSKRKDDTVRAAAYYRRFHDLSAQLAAAEPQNPAYQAGLVQGKARLASIENTATTSSRPASRSSGPGEEP